MSNKCLLAVVVAVNHPILGRGLKYRGDLVFSFVRADHHLPKMSNSLNLLEADVLTVTGSLLTHCVFLLNMNY